MERLAGVLDDMRSLLESTAATASADDSALKGATSYGNLPLSDRGRVWDATAASGRVRKWASSDGSGDKEKMDWKKYQKAFFWYDSTMADGFGGYKLGFADILDGTLTAAWRGVTAVAAVLQGSRGGVQIPDADANKVKAHVAKYYAKAASQFGDDSITVPWDNASRDGDSKAVEQLLVEFMALDALR